MNPRAVNEVKNAVIKQLFSDYHLVPKSPTLYKFDDYQMMEELLAFLSSEMDIDPVTIRSKSRKTFAVRTRQIFFYIVKKTMYSNIDLTTIGSFAGGKDHATVLHGIGVCENLSETDKVFREHLKYLSLKFKNKFEQEHKITVMSDGWKKNNKSK